MEGKISGIVQIDGSELRDIVKQALREALQDHPRCGRCGAEVARTPARTPDPPPRLMRADDVVTLTGLAKSTIYRLMSISQFPAAVKIGPRAVRWRVEEVQAWISERSRATYTPPP